MGTAQKPKISAEELVERAVRPSSCTSVLPPKASKSACPCSSMHVPAAQRGLQYTLPKRTGE